MTHYYFLATALPALEWGVPPELSPEELRDLLDDHLTASDRLQLMNWRLLFTLENLRALWRGLPVSRWGTMSQVELEEALLLQEGLPGYVYLFMERYTDREKRLQHFPSLIKTYYQEAIRQTRGLIQRYLQFDRELSLVMVGFRAKRLGRDLLQELQFEDPEDPLVAQILAQRDAAVFEPPSVYLALRPLFHAAHDHALQLYEAIAYVRFKWLQDTLDGTAPFSFDSIAAYVMQYYILRQWSKLDFKRGAQIVDTLVEEIL